MESLVIHRTPKTPEIHCDGNNGIIELEGRSIPENTYEFYLPVMNWIEKYKTSPAAQTQVKINLDYFNTTSSKSIFDILKEMEHISKITNVIVNWYYEEDDDDMFDAGKNIEALIMLTFNMIQVPSGTR